MDKQNKRRKLTTSNSKSKDIISSSTTRSVLNRHVGYTINQYKRLKIPTMSSTSVNDGKFTTFLISKKMFNLFFFFINSLYFIKYRF